MDSTKLRSVALSSNYQAILDVMEYECDLAEQELLGADPSNAAKVVAAHSRARAYREFFNRFQATVKREISQEIEPRTLSNLEIVQGQCL